MGNTIFRKSSMERLKSPEQLNEYIRVANPGVWLILAAIILLLVGVIVWGVFGTVETKVRSGALAEGGAVVCYVDEDAAAALESGMAVRVGEAQGTVKAVSGQPVLLDETADPYLLYLGGFSAGDFCYVVEIAAPGLQDGVYPAEITVDSIRPITFVIR